ncbi:hypothetical protein ACTVKF_18490 [Serratia marcescens]|uniref:hypothetical protein n=1 Tax=Serratia TaxID=613 RepID=UPI00159EBC6B|nr:hypothetical protein [Serratia marcescens]MDX6807926.1 hypothetical protein [Serratia marcescens]HBC7448619.1 hypothetical protein [Serratia marcescens]
MTTIKRFTPDYKMHAVRFEAFAREAEHGEYVRFDAHQQAESALEAERDALADRVNVLAVENAAMRAAIGDIADTLETGTDGMLFTAVDNAVNLEVTQTDAALAAIQAQGVERLIKLKMEQLANMHPDTHAFGATAESLRSQINELQAFATELREAK